MKGLPDPGIKPTSALAGTFSTAEMPWKPNRPITKTLRGKGVYEFFG